MIRVGSLFLFSLLFSLVSAQTQAVRNIEKFDTQYTLTDFNGQPLNRNYNGLEGIPFVVDKYYFGEIVLKNGRKFENIRLKIDIVSNEIVFLSPNNEAASISSDFIKEVSYSDTSDLGVKKKVFKTGLPAIDNNKSNSFYLVIAEGEISLLKSMVKKIDTRKNDFTGEIVRELRLYNDLYVLQNQKLTRFKRDKEFLLELFNNKRRDLDVFLKEHKGSFKNEEYLATIFNYYNSGH